MGRWISLGLIFLAGCSAAPASVEYSQPPPPTTPEAMPPKPDVPNREIHIQDALSELERSERAVERSVQARLAPKPPVPPTPNPPTPVPGQPTRPSEPQEPDTPACETACTALASMRRSARYLCELTGSEDARCKQADERVRRAEARVESTCGACGAAVSSRD